MQFSGYEFPTHGQRRRKPWHERDAEIEHRASIGPIIRRHVADLFPDSSTAASRRLRKLATYKRINFVGTVLLHEDGGRPNHVYCGWRCKIQELRHDVLTTDICFQYYPEADIRRGPEVDQSVRPDAELIFNDGRHFCVELDTGSEDLGKVEKRFKTYQVYASSQSIILFVTLSKTRLKNVIAVANSVQNMCVFSTYQQVMLEPRGPIWIDVHGQPGSIT